MIVDNILKDSGEVYGSDDEDLSGDEIKSPVFVITKVAAENAANRNMEDPENIPDMTDEMEQNDEEEIMGEEDKLFVQEEVSHFNNNNLSFIL